MNILSDVSERVSDLLERVRALVFRGREEREMAEEFRFHVDMATDQNRRSGAEVGEARRRGLIAFGGVERYKEEMRDARGTRFLQDTLGDFAQAVRTLRHNPRFAVVAILTLAVGIGGTTAVFSAVDAVLLKPLPYAEPGRLVRLYGYQLGSESDKTFISPPHFGAYRTNLSSFEGLAATFTYSEHGADIGTGDGAERIRVLPVSADYFAVMRAQPVIGRAFERSEETDAPLVILSHRLWERLFAGHADAVGTTLTMSGIPRTIVGVMPSGYTDPVVGDVDAWTPGDLKSIDDAQQAGNHYLTVLGRLRSGVPPAQASAELDALGRSLAAQYPGSWISMTRAELTPLKEDVVGSAGKTLELMLGAVGLVLLLVCVNLANLLLVRGSERAREFALRAALGAEQGRLVRQLLTECLALALVGGVAGLALGRAMMPAIVALGGGSIPRLTHLSLDWPVMAFAFVVASASAIAFGLVPALRGSRTQPAGVMRENSQATTSSRSLGRLRSALVVSQVALAFVLLIGAGLLIASVNQLQRTDLGVVANDVLTFDLNLPSVRYDAMARARFYDAFAREVEAIPGVRAAGGVSKLPATGDYHSWGTEALSGPLAGKKEGSLEAQNRVVSGD
jgi:putative ABC transport system permease protein